MSKSLSYFKAVRFCLLHFALKILFHFASISCYILCQKLLHFGSKVVTFCINVTFCVNCYILRHNNCLTWPKRLNSCSCLIWANQIKWHNWPKSQNCLIWFNWLSFTTVSFGSNSSIHRTVSFGLTSSNRNFSFCVTGSNHTNVSFGLIVTGSNSIVSF